METLREGSEPLLLHTDALKRVIVNSFLVGEDGPARANELEGLAPAHLLHARVIHVHGFSHAAV